MKSQTLGLVLGLNVAVACLVLQGCKANKPGSVKPAQDAVVVVDEDVSVEPVKEETVKDTPPAITVTEEVKAPVVEKVPSTPPPPPPKKVVVVAKVPAAPVETTSYVVRPGDTLSGIAVRHNIKMSAILAVNPGMNPNRIFVGRKIKLPGKVAVAAAPAATPAKKVAKVAAAPVTAAKTTAPVTTKKASSSYKGATKDYTVKSGDILGKIAYENGITIRQLKELNGLKSNNIRVGQTLKIPAEKVVKKAAAKKAVKVDTANAKAIEPKVEAKKEAAKPAVEEKKPAAEPATTVTTAETVAPAPAVEAPATPAPATETATAPEAAPAPAAAASTYVVKEGQDILSIAVDFGISPAQLLDVNNMKMTDPVKPGDVLKLPAGVKQPTAQ